MKILIIICISMNLYSSPIIQEFNKKFVNVKKEYIEYKKEYFGKTTIDESKVFDVRLRYSGFIENINKNKNYMKVNKGDKLFNIYSEEALKVLKEYNLSKNKYSLKKLEYLELSPNMKEIFTIKSKYNGYIMTKNINENSFLKKGELAYQIVDLSNIWIEGEFYQKDLNLLKKNQDVIIKINGETILSKIDIVYPLLKNKKGIFRINYKNKKQLIPNMFVKLEVIFSKQEHLILPDTSVLKKFNKFYVFIESEEGIIPKEIEAKKYKNKYIVKGILEGQKVIDKSIFLLDSDAISNSLYDSEDEEW